MALSDLAARPVNGPAHKECGTCWVLGQLDAEQAKNLRAALANTSVRYDEIYAELDALGLGAFDKDSLRRHAGAGCSARERLRIGRKS